MYGLFPVNTTIKRCDLSFVDGNPNADHQAGSSKSLGQR